MNPIPKTDLFQFQIRDRMEVNWFEIATGISKSHAPWLMFAAHTAVMLQDTLNDG